jgi:hypothetical protein
MSIVLITGFAPVKLTFPEMVPAFASSTPGGVPAALFVGSFFGAAFSDCGFGPPQPVNSSAETIPQAME